MPTHSPGELPGDVAQAFADALDMLWGYAQEQLEDHDGDEPMLIIDWHAPGVEPGTYDAEIEAAQAALRRPDDRGPGEPGPR